MYLYIPMEKQTNTTIEAFNQLNLLITTMGMAGIKENPCFDIREISPDDLLICFRKQECVPLDFRINDKVCYIKVDDIQLDWPEEISDILYNPTWFQEIIEFLFLYTIRIVRTSTKNIVEIYSAQDELISSATVSGKKDQPEFTGEQITTYKPVRIFTPQEQEEYNMQVRIRHSLITFPEEDITLMRNRKRIFLRGRAWFNYFYPSIGLILFPLIYLMFFIWGGSLKDVMSSIPAVTGPVVIAGIFLFLYQYSNLRLRIFTTHYTEDQFYNALRKAVNIGNWTFLTYSPELIIASNNPYPVGINRRELIYIFKEKEKILIRSISEPDGKSFPFSFGRNKKNEKLLLSALHESGVDIKK